MGEVEDGDALATPWMRTGMVMEVSRTSEGKISGTWVQKTGPHR